MKSVNQGNLVFRDLLESPRPYALGKPHQSLLFWILVFNDIRLNFQGFGLRLVNMVIFFVNLFVVVWWSFSADLDEPNDCPMLLRDDAATESKLIVFFPPFVPPR